DLRADRHLQRHAGAVRAGAVAAHAMRADGRLEVLLEAEIDQRVEAVDGLHPHVAAAPAVAAVRAAEFHEFFAAERDSPCPAVAGAEIDFCFVQELHWLAVCFTLIVMVILPSSI